MGRTTAGARWRRLLVLMAATSGAAAAWVGRKRGGSGWRELSWSDPDPVVDPRPRSAEPTGSVVTRPAEPVVPAPSGARGPAEPTESTEPAEFTDIAEFTEPAEFTGSAGPSEPVGAPSGARVPAVAEPPTLFDDQGLVEPGRYPNSALPRPDGSAPTPEYVIKGNTGSMRSHAPSSPYFGRTRAEVWFRTEEDAVAAGFRPWSRKK